jgi:hypothetical protein
MTGPVADTGDLLNAQTGRITWPELARHFARGMVVCVNRELDLIEVAQCLVDDQAKRIAQLHKEGVVHRAQDEDAVRWEAGGTEFWSVVVAPWILIQEA